MFFCENCNCLMQEPVCSVCGKKNLREAADDDFCYFTMLSPSDAHFLEINLQSEDIPVAKISAGRINFTNGSSGKFKIYIPYAYIEKAKEICALLAIECEA